jgi:hypothetical protein
MMQNGKMMMVKNGQMTVLDDDMTMSNGTKLMSDGTYINKDGKKLKLKEGQLIIHNLNKDKMKDYQDQNQRMMTLTTDRGMLTGMFRDRESTEHAYNDIAGKRLHKRRHQFGYVRRNAQKIFFR